MRLNKCPSILIGLALAVISFSGCSVISKEVVDCPQITAMPEAAEAFVKEVSFTAVACVASSDAARELRRHTNVNAYRPSPR